jgi:nucleotide-binding universal stress UspA family protein
MIWHQEASKHILVPVDGSPESEAACWSAAELAPYVGAAITILHVAQPQVLRSSFDSAPQWREAQEAAQVAGERIVSAVRSGVDPDVPCTTEVLFGDPAGTVCRRARDLDVDLIVIGSRGLSTVKRLLLGNVSSAVSQQAPCSVLVVRERASRSAKEREPRNSN